MPEIICANSLCAYNGDDNYCNCDDTVKMSWHSIMTLWDGRQEFWKCKNYQMSDDLKYFMNALENVK